MSDGKFKVSEKVVYSCKYYVVWCTQYRRKILVEDIAVRLKEAIETACEEKMIGINRLEILPNHVKMVIEVEPQLGVHRAVKHIKRCTAGLRNEFEDLQGKVSCLWTYPYLVSTVGDLPEEEVEEFIESQKTSQRE